jgi:hypothetical protein
MHTLPFKASTDPCLQQYQSVVFCIVGDAARYIVRVRAESMITGMYRHSSRDFMR